MLWTDRQFITVQDLSTLDSEFAEVADAENIAVTGPNNLIIRALEESGEELRKLLVSFGGYMGGGDVSPNHIQAVMNVNAGNTVRQRAQLYQVVVSGENEDTWNHVKRWAGFWVLFIFYRDAFNRTVKDRYEGKMRFYKAELQRRLEPSIQTLGVPVVLSPLFAPAARFSRNSGFWTDDNVVQAGGPGTVNGSYDFVVTYVDMSDLTKYVSAANPNNAESAPSERQTLQLFSGNVAQIDISTLNPPTGIQHPADRVVYPCLLSKATHWNVYAGKAGSTLFLQNATPIPIATTTYTLAGDPTLRGYTVGQGQYPDRVFVVQKTRQRA